MAQCHILDQQKTKGPLNAIGLLGPQSTVTPEMSVVTLSRRGTVNARQITLGNGIRCGTLVEPLDENLMVGTCD